MKIYDLMIQNNLAEYGGVSHEEIEEYQRKLYKAGIAVLPMAYTGFLMLCNGVQTDTLSLFGISKKGSFVRDIYQENSIAGSANADEIFLGDNFSEYLSYDWAIKSFAIVNKDNREKIKIFPFWEQALEYFLREYINGTNAATIEDIRKKIKK
jgi:hypothetical protein